MRFRVRRARLVVDQRHLAEEVAAIEHGQRFLADARDEFRDAHAAVEDDVELLALLAFPENHRAFAEALLAGERRQQLHFTGGEAALLEEIDLVFRLDGDLLHLARPFDALAALTLLRILLEEELELFVRVAHFLRERAPEGPVQADGELLVLVHELVERAEEKREATRRYDRHGVAGAMRAVDEIHLAENRAGRERAEDLRTEGRVLADFDAAV